jgi:DNA-binding transcriptional MerR regulator
MIDSLEKKYYKIREVTAILDVPASTLRFWESQFSVLKPKRNSHKTRFYTPRDIETLKMIKYLLKDKGLKIDAAEEQLRHNHEGVSRRRQAVERLVTIKSELEKVLNALNKMR